MSRKVDRGVADPFDKDTKFFWDSLYIFDVILIDEQMRGVIRKLFEELNKSENEMIRKDSQKKMSELFKNLEHDKFNNLYHVMDSLLPFILSPDVLKSGKDAIRKDPKFLELCKLIEVFFDGKFIKTIAKNEKSEEFDCMALYSVLELEKNVYNPLLGETEIQQIFEFLQNTHPKAMVQPDPKTEIFHFDFHKLAYEEIGDINKWFETENLNIKKKVACSS